MFSVCCHLELRKFERLDDAICVYSEHLFPWCKSYALGLWFDLIFQLGLQLSLNLKRWTADTIAFVLNLMNKVREKLASVEFLKPCLRLMLA